MNSQSRKVFKLLALAGVVGAGLGAQPAYAVCTAQGVTRYIIGQGTPLVVRADASEGDVLRSNQASNDGKIWYVNCTTAGEQTFASRYNKVDPVTIVPLKVMRDGSEVDAGVGVVIAIRENDDAGFQSLPAEKRRTLEANKPFGITDTVQYELRRMSGPVEYGTVLSKEVAWSGITGSTAYFRRIWVEDLVIARPSCSISADSLEQEVNLGTHNATEFPKPGDSTSWTTFRLISADCADPAGVIGDFTFGTLADADGSNANLFNLGTGAARGAGIALARADADDTAILPGQVTSIAAVPTGDAYEFKARLTRTTANFAAGTFSKAVVVQVDFR